MLRSSSPPRLAHQVTALTYDDLAEGLQYDPASQVTNIVHQIGASSTQINKADYLYNNVGNRTSLTDRRGPQTFGYDTLDRLTSASHPLLGTPQAVTCDPVGNRTTGGAVVNAGNQLTADATHSYQYDDNGNLTRKTLLATGNFTAYTYDAENRLTKVEDFTAGNPTASATSTYRYDGLGRRIEKVTPTGTRRYVYDGEDILLEYDGTNTLQARYTHGPGIDEPIAITKGGNTFFYHQDELGSVTELTDSVGAVAKAYAYDTYGNVVDQTGTVEQPYAYTGRELDSESGLYFYRSRYYDPTTGRFLQRDLIGFAGGINLYGYVGQSPTNFVDPFGFGPTGAAIGGTIGGAIGAAGGAVIGGFGGAVGGTAALPGGETIAGGSYGAAQGAIIGSAIGVTIGAAIGSLIEDLAKKSCDDNPCPPCKLVDGTIVPVGTIVYRFDDVQSGKSKKYWPFKGNHYSLYQAHQNKGNRRCFWVPVGVEAAPPPRSIPIRPFAN